MKHSVVVTLVLVSLFLASQLIGLFVVQEYVDIEATASSGVVTYKQLPSVGPLQLERPQIEQDVSFVWLFGGILIATLVMLLLIRWRSVRLWKVWFFLAVVITLTIAFGAFVPGWLAGLLAVILGVWKVWRPGIIVQNATELFIYAGLAAMFVPVMNLSAAVILLVLISLYDAYAVWKSEHMVRLAKFQSNAGVFAGLLIPYGIPGALRADSKGGRMARVRTAILGGGDLGFPLLFAGVVMRSAGVKAFIIPVAVTAALLALLMFAKKDRFYPAMPFLAAGCLVGWVLTLV